VLARLTVFVAVVLLGILVPLVRLPVAWVALAGGQPALVRLAMLAVLLVVVMIGRTLLFSRLPRAAVLFGRKVRFHDGTRRRAVAVADIAAMHVELRPPPLHEVFVVEQYDGEEHDLCPTHWSGAPALHRTLDRRVAAAHRRRTRAASKALRGSRKVSDSA